MSLSIIIPAKNEEKYIEGCLSALEKAVDNWGGEAEVILVDNGSADTTREIAKLNGCRVIEKADGSIGGLRNLGASNARCSILAFLDADCLVDPNWISYCLQNFVNKKIAIVGTRAIPDLTCATWVERAWYRLISGAERPDFVDWLGSSNLFINKKTFFNIGGFDESLETAEDIDFCYRVRKEYLIFLEKRINTIHLKESKNLVDLFKREYWRGQSSLKLFLNNLNLKELPSVVIPIVNLLGIIAFFVFIVVGSRFYLVPILVVLAFPIILLIKKKIKSYSLRDLFECYIVALTYILARSGSIIYDTYKLLRAALNQPNNFK